MSEWQPIETAPKTRHILITDGVLLPDLVLWRSKTPERVVDGTLHLSVPEGWFCLWGGRSRIKDPTHWYEIPDYRNL